MFSRLDCEKEKRRGSGGALVVDESLTIEESDYRFFVD